MRCTARFDRSTLQFPAIAAMQKGCHRPIHFVGFPPRQPPAVAGRERYPRKPGTRTLLCWRLPSTHPATRRTTTMWTRDEAVRPTVQPQGMAPVAAMQQTTAPSPQPEFRRIERDVVNIGKSVVIKGELSGSEDLTIEGQVDGKIELKEHALTIGPNGKIKAQVFAKSVIVLGEVNGNVSATDKVDIRDGGSVDGDIVSPRVAIAEGAH